MRKFFIVSAVAIVLASSQANAQISWQPNFNLAPAMLQAQVLNPCPNGDCNRRSDSSNKQPAAAMKSRTVVNSAKLQYSPSLEQRRRNLEQFVSSARLNDPEGAAQLEQLFASNDVIGVVGQGIAPFGLKVTDIADAYAVYWTNAWLGSRGRDDTPSKQQFSAVRNQAASMLLASPEISSASNADKQQMAEAMLVQAALIGIFVESGKSNPALMSKVKVAIAQGAKAMGLDLYTMDLTPQGFVPAKKGSMVDDTTSQPNDPGNVEQSLASNMPPADSQPNYILIAAAGGAGFGGMFLLGRAMGRKS